MSAAGSRLRLESPTPELSEFKGPQEDDETPEHEALERLTAISPPSSGPIIAIDLDDVLSQTNQAVADCKYSHIPHFIEVYT